MGDVRFTPPLEAVKNAKDKAGALAALSDEEVVSALAASAREPDPYLANVLATEAHNRFLKLRAITDSMEEGVIAGRACGAVSYVNAAAERILRIDGALLKAGEGDALLHLSREAAQRHHRLVAEQFAARGSARLEFEMRRADGERFWSEQAITSLRDAAGETVGWAMHFRDVTGERETRERLREALDLHEAIFASVDSHLLVLDERLRVVKANRAFLRHHGLDEKEVVGRPLGDVVPVPPENEAVLREVLVTGRPFESLQEPGQRDGRVWDWGAVPLRHADGRVRGLFIAGLDSTERSRLRGVRRRFLSASEA